MGLFDSLKPEKGGEEARPKVTVAVPTEDGDLSVTAPSKPVEVDLNRLNDKQAEKPVSEPSAEVLQSVAEHEQIMGVDADIKPDFKSLDEFRARSMRDAQLKVAPEDLKNGEATKEYEISSAAVIQSYEQARREARKRNKKAERVMLGLRVTKASRTWLKRRMFEKDTDMTEWILGAINKRLHDEGINDIIID